MRVFDERRRTSHVAARSIAVSLLLRLLAAAAADTNTYCVIVRITERKYKPDDDIIVDV